MWNFAKVERWDVTHGTGKAILVPALLLKYSYGEFPLESPEAKLELYTEEHFHILFFFLNIEISVGFFFFFLILSWVAIWVKTNKRNLEVRAVRVVSNQWVTFVLQLLLAAALFYCQLEERFQDGSGRLMSSVIILISGREGVMNWNFRVQGD